MSSRIAEQDAFFDLLVAIEDVLAGVSEAKQLMGDLPADPAAFAQLDVVQRTAARALLKCVEQLQDLLARSLRTLLILEQVEVAGLSPRAIADRAETLGILESSDVWSALVRLRNQLVHEYPLPRLQQYARLSDAWFGAEDLRSIAASITHYAKHSLNLRSDHERN